MARAVQVLSGIAVTAAALLTNACTGVEAGYREPDFSADQTYHYDGVVRFDPEAGTVAAEWTIYVNPDRSGPLSFLLNPRLEDIEVSGGDVARAEIGAGEGALGAFTGVDVTLAPGDGAMQSFDIAYGGPLFDTVDREAINIVAPDKIELTVDSFWMPFDARFSETLTAEVEIDAPGEWVAVVSTGQARLTEQGASISNTTPQLDIAVTMMSQAREVSTARYQVFDTRGGDQDLTGIARIADDCTRYLDDRFGEREPLPVASIVIHERSDSGYSRGTLIALTDVAEDPGPAQHMFICHEFAHFWASNGNAGTVENWLNESFAEYIGVMAVREAVGEEAAQALLDRFRDQLDVAGAQPAIWTPGATERRPYLVNYRKGPLALAALEARIGRDAFAEFMRRAMVDRIATTPDLLAALEAVAGADHRAWFERRLAQ